jgi:pyridoxamine 5'-phosphate oxidase-like protein
MGAGVGEERLEPLIEPEVQAFLESPCSQIVATVDAAGLPEASRGWAVDVLAGGRQLRLLLASSEAVTLANLAATGVIALTATHFETLSSVQIKGRVSSLEPRTAADRIRFEQFCAGCVHAIATVDNTPEEVIWRMQPVDVVACLVDVEAVYDQTPGPVAGTRLAPVEA